MTDDLDVFGPGEGASLEDLDGLDAAIWIGRLPADVDIALGLPGQKSIAIRVDQSVKVHRVTDQNIEDLIEALRTLRASAGDLPQGPS